MATVTAYAVSPPEKLSVTPGTSCFPRKLMKTPFGWDVKRFKSWKPKNVSADRTHRANPSARQLAFTHLDSFLVAQTSDDLQARGADV